MKLLEIKNNLVKIAYSNSETPVLGRFVVIASTGKSYVAQFVNLKSDNVNSYAIAKLLFTFTPDGVVDNYDGSAPDINSGLSFLQSSELLELLPIETPIKLGTLSQQDDMLNIDVSVFERNFTVFAEKDSNKSVFISNCVRQLFRMKEKCVIADNANLFENYPKLEVSKDYKLPLNCQMLDYIFEYDLMEVDMATKAVIQDIFYELQEYIKTLDDGFIPIEKFVNVVAQQYKALQMPELALLKNKLLRYRDAGIFADTIEEIHALRNSLLEKNCIIIDTKDMNDCLQKTVMSYVHSILNSFDKYVYFFVTLTDENSDKKLLKQFINHNHVFTTMITGCNYKYTPELLQHAQNIMLFAPMSANHNFITYNTFLNKITADECIVEGKLTQGIPFIIRMEDLDVDLTKDDVFGERCQFVPVLEEVRLVKYDDYGREVTIEDEQPKDTVIEQPDFVSEQVNEQDLTEELPIVEPENSDIILPPSDIIVENDIEQQVQNNSTIIKPVANIMEEEEIVENPFQNHASEEFVFPPENQDQISEENTDIQNDYTEEVLTEEDLNFIDNNLNSETFEQSYSSEDEQIETQEAYEESPYVEDQVPVVPVYPAEEDAPLDSVGDFHQGDAVTHPRYGRGVIEKIIKYGNKTLCSISFENVGRRLLDPTISELTKLG